MTSRHINHVAGMLSADPSSMDRLAREMSGMDSASLDKTLQALVAISNGRMPDPQITRWLEAEAKTAYGWDSKQTRAEIKRVADLPSPQQRIFGYLSAGGRPVSEQSFQSALEFTQHAARANAEAALSERMAEADTRNSVDGFKAMPASERALKDTQDRQSLRGAIASHFGGEEPKSFYQQRAAVARARSQLADRIDKDMFQSTLDSINGRETPAKSMRDTLRDSYDLEAVRSASIEFGFGDVNEQANEDLRETEHTDDDHDITEQLR